MTLNLGDSGSSCEDIVALTRWVSERLFIHTTLVNVYIMSHVPVVFLTFFRSS